MNFVWNNIDSRTFSLRLAHIGSPGVVVTSGAPEIEIIQDRTTKRSEPFIYGTQMADNIEFEVTAMNRSQGHQYSSYESQAIQEWLTNGGSNRPSWFMLLSPDMGNEGYLAFLRNIRAVRIGDKVVGFRFVVHVVGGHSYSNIVESRYELTTSMSYINFMNLSNVREYFRPVIEVELLGNTTFFAFSNITDDSSRTFELHNLIRLDKIHIDCDRKILRAESGDDVFNKSNLEFPRFGIGMNRCFINGTCRLKISGRWRKLVPGY